MGQVLTGTPFIGYVSLTASGFNNFALFYTMGAASVSIGTLDKLYITNITMSSNDTAQALITVDTGGTTPTKLANAYLSSTQPPLVESVPAGCCHAIAGTVPRANASAVTGGKTVEIIIKGYVSRT